MKENSSSKENNFENDEKEVFEDALDDFESLSLNKNATDDNECNLNKNEINNSNFEDAKEEKFESDSDEYNSENEELNDEHKLKFEKYLELKEEGNCYFRKLDFETSINFYNKALNEIPKRFLREKAILYNNRAASKLNMYKANPNKEKLEKEKNEKNDIEKKTVLGDIIKDLSKSIKLDKTYLKPYLKRAEVYRLLGGEELDNCLEDYKKSLEFVPKENIKLNQEIVEEINKINVEINLRNEKLKAEMISSLKSLGNIFLSNFGITTDNFEFIRNEETGSYKVNLK